MVLAGGLATRMRPLTEKVPKVLLPVAGRPFVDWLLERLAAAGYDDVVLCLGYLGEQVETYVGDGARHGLRVRYAYDGDKLVGTGGALRRALPLLDEAFLVTYGDSYLPFDYRAPLAVLEAHPAWDGVMAVYRNAGQWDASNVKTDGRQVLSYVKGTQDPAHDHIDYGALALRRQVVEARLPEGVPSDLSTLQHDLAAEGRMGATVAQERFHEIGSPAGLAALQGLLLGEGKGRGTP